MTLNISPFKAPPRVLHHFSTRGLDEMVGRQGETLTSR